MNGGTTPGYEDAGLLSEQPLMGDDVSPIMSKVSTPATPGSAATQPLTAGADKFYQRLCFAPEGVLYEDSQIQIGLKTEYHNHQGRLALYFGNKIAVNFNSFTVSVRSQEPSALSVVLPKIPTNTLGAMTQAQTLVVVECKDLFTLPPILTISYLAGSLQELRLRLPVLLPKFIEPVQLGATDFFERWRQIGGPPREAQKVFPFRLSSAGEVDTTRQRRVIEGARFQHLDGVDPNPTNSVAAGVLHMKQAGKVGCLLRLEPNRDAKLARLTVRTTNDVASAELLRILLVVLGVEQGKL